MSKGDEIDDRISHPGRPDMRFSESLANFLIHNGKKATQFRTMHWVIELSDDSLGHLKQLAETFLHDGPDEYLDDMVQASIFAVGAESQTKISLDEVTPNDIYEWVTALRIIVALEGMRRSGLVTLREEPGITTVNNLSVTLTDRGVRAGLDLRAKLN